MSKDPFSSSAPMYTQPPRQRGCFFYGCLITVIVAVLGLLTVGTLLYMGYRTLASTLLEYSDDTAQPIPKVELAPDLRASLDARVKIFKEALDANKPTEPLVLNSDELNTLIAEGAPEMSNRVHVELVGDKLQGRVSLPMEGLDLFGLFGLKGKFINAKGEFKVSLENGVLIVVLDQAEVKGKPLPEKFMQAVRNDNLAQEAYKDPRNAETLGKISSITIKDDKITITANDPDKKKSETGDTKEEPKAKEAPKDDKPTEPAKAKEAPKDDKPAEPAKAKEATKADPPKTETKEAPKADPPKTEEKPKDEPPKPETKPQAEPKKS